jgi:hypothetical protein
MPKVRRAPRESDAERTVVTHAVNGRRSVSGQHNGMPNGQPRHARRVTPTGEIGHVGQPRRTLAPCSQSLGREGRRHVGACPVAVLAVVFVVRFVAGLRSR